ncbi:hypothetical protein TNCV_3597031 [Trichonephila clavipes]|nr:hypothetical protein TNCV_3597031 [Trichonephila clavipes]
MVIVFTSHLDLTWDKGVDLRSIQLGRPPSRRVWDVYEPQNSNAYTLGVTSQPAFFAHANVFHHDDKPLPIELFIATISSNGSDPEVICITLNHAGLTSTAKDIRSINYTNDRFRQVRPLSNSVPVEYFPFCARGKFSQLVQGKLSYVGQRNGPTKNISKVGIAYHGLGDAFQRLLRRKLSQPPA